MSVSGRVVSVEKHHSLLRPSKKGELEAEPGLTRAGRTQYRHDLAGIDRYAPTGVFQHRRRACHRLLTDPVGEPIDRGPGSGGQTTSAQFRRQFERLGDVQCQTGADVLPLQQ